MPSGHDPMGIPVFPRDKREAFARRHAQTKDMERDDDTKKSHPPQVQAGMRFLFLCSCGDFRADSCAFLTRSRSLFNSNN